MIHLSLKNFSDALICLNHAIKQSKFKAIKNLDIVFKDFYELGRPKLCNPSDGIETHPKLLFAYENPLSILVK